MNFLKKNWVTVLIVLATLVLAGIAVFTAIRLYQLRQGPVAPNVPSSQPGAFQYGADCASLTTQDACQAKDCRWDVSKNRCGKGNACIISFSLLTVASPSVTPSVSPSPSLSPSPSPTIPPSCGDTCDTSADCGTGMTCSTEGICRNPSCSTEEDCLCAGTPTPTATATPAPPLSCGDSCSSNADCTNSMVCSNGLCRNPSCLNATNCLCGTSTPSGTIVAGTSTPAPELPQSGTSLPALIGAGAGILLLLGAFVLAL